ncbi:MULTISPECIES: amino acid permease [Aneurinibacillus]|uniref:Lysine:proton symporter, AAT family n=2 Tax=Aneurinibacillus thermoaerophilus TaxID=143495 RepID=A0A1G7XZ79_ANETH|nr:MULTISPECIES: amino acid permease [Aneurinibacillus]MED0677779.1 amino acid permease [Aneurinibacillus thermoaerophilus]MED0737528.1 amino acid permease [Aneurinibacillus thermoaerophilus]MED0758099.1 amino acid permease [Aneurinibacillus thermoaerophilus]MED0761253.1 amino acid permease [Aneurinibacillus thermoaerophilus]MED0762855.1 amino acid permease [Aneurinibacillus thermoaerophilus]
MSQSPLQVNEMIEPVTDTSSQLHRGLRARHLTMIAIGGSIGTGLFLASGATIHSAGPGGALVAYLAISIMVYFLMTSLGEMATFLPVSGSFSSYASRFVDPALGFALGWNYWYNWAVTIAVEISAGALIMKFWFPDSSSLLWSVLFLGIMFGLNYLSVKGYGEGEYWFALIKVISILAFIIVGISMIFGIMGGEAVGFKNFTVGDAPFHGGFMAIFSVFIIAGFSFQGTELVGIAAGESEKPGKNVPRAIKQVFWRILLFYILAILIIGLMIPYTDERLINSDIENIAVSPFTLVFEKAGLAFAASVMNAIILTAVLSAGNSGMYACTRMLWMLAKEGKAPKFLGKVNKRGIPVNALYITSLVGMLAFLSSLFGDGTVYIWLLNASGMSGFIAWVGIAICHYRFRRAYVAQGGDINALPYKAKWFPFGPLFALVLCIIIILGQNYGAFMEEKIDWNGVLVSYIGLPLFLILWLGYKFIKKTKVIPLHECDFSRDQ